MADRKPSTYERLRRALLGAPIPSSKAHHERLGPLIGLPVFSSDALSSVAYATEAILLILILHGRQALHFQFAISVAILFLIILVGFSYTQTIQAYPKGGGAYIVASDNLGETPGLIAGAALLIDYVLTVAVSVAAGVAAIVSAYPHLHNYLVPSAMICTALVAWLNLRGVKESGAVFAVPTYGFVLAIAVMLAVAIFKAATGPAITQQVIAHEHAGDGHDLVGLSLVFILLRAFAAGCTALTGIEAVADGVQAFRAPESRNAITTLKWMIVILSITFLGIGYIAQHIPTLSLFTAEDKEYRTLVSQVAAYAFGQGSIGFYIVQYMTAAILVLAANTAFADFPRLASFLARDGFLPRALARQGDRLVFHNGIILLSVAAAALIWWFGGKLDQLLPLYAVGVFTAFFLSQTSMVVHWRKLKPEGWKRSLAINAMGMVLTGAVLLIILITKFTEGAWIVLILFVMIFLLLRSIKKQYNWVGQQLAVKGGSVAEVSRSKSLLLVPRVHRGVLSALQYALKIDPNCEAVHVTLDERRLPTVQRDWEKYGGGVPLVILKSPFRSLIRPVLDYVDELHEQDPNQIVTVIVAEAVSNRFIQRVLTENVASQLKQALGSRRNVVVANVRYFVD